MADLIEADYGALDQVHNKFTQEAEAFEQTLRNIRARMEPLEDGGWIGDAADAFFREMNDEVLPACQRLHQAFEQAAATTKKVGDTVHEAEQEATNAFKIR